MSTKLVLFLISLHCLAIKASSLDTVRQNETLNSSSQLVSVNGIFTLGFHTPTETNNSYLAVWLTSKSDKPVWIANRDKPIPRNSTPVLTLGSRGELVITHNGGETVELYAGVTSSSGRNVTATLLDSGNFIVREMIPNSPAGEILWQSFDHPTDALLPGMKMGVNYRTGRNWTLSSWFGQDDPAPGLFTLEWDPSVGGFLVRRRGAVYWRSGELKYYDDDVTGDMRVYLENFGFRQDPFNFNYNFTRVDTDEEKSLIFSILPIPYSTEKVMSGWRLDYLGDIFDIDRSVTITRPSLCYNYFKQRSAVFRGCEPREQPSFRSENQQFVYKSGYFRQDKGRLDQIYDDNSSLSLSDCQEACWKDRECVAYVGGGSGCLYWNGENLEYVQSVDGSAVQRYFLDSASSSKGLKKHVQIILIVVGLTLLLTFSVALFVMRKLKHGKKEKELRELMTLDGYTETHELKNGGAKTRDLEQFTYASILSATNNFSLGNKLGQGGFGPVYKGKTREGQYIAVKRLSGQSGQGLLEFKTELILISKLQHVNLVKLLGFCIHGDDKLIIYDYMHNKSLDFFIFSPSMREQLDWQKRFNIIEGTAQGLLYLHKYSRLKIIHRDLKPSNILLDKNMNPKISDFGLARIFKHNAADEANTNRRAGTYGYMAPEYAMQGIFSVKSDVYSFGVLVLEIVSGRKNSGFHEIEGPLNLVEYAWELWRNDFAVEIMDPTLRDSCVIEQLQKCIHIGLLCVENHAVNRPTIEDVITMLRNETKNLPMPKNPAFITRNSVVEEAEKSTAPKKSSTNELSLSEIQGR